jgi:sigma-B regulation protein RsbU (phosphoserine phosphatase)
MIAMRPTLESLHRSSRANTQSDEQLADQYRRQIHLAGRMQRDLMPNALPRIEGVKFSVVFRPMEDVSGDAYDVRRVDDDHVAVAMVDAQGHGICAALLSVFIKRALRAEELNAASPQAHRPDRVLTRLNEELLEAQLPESQFAAAVYLLLNLRTNRMLLARGGAPYPIVRRADRRIELLRPPGPVLGVVPNASFTVASVELNPGDSVIVHSDGLELVADAVEPRRTGLPNAVAPDQAITATRWCECLRVHGPEQALAQLTGRYDTLRRLGGPLDDLTAIALRIED